MPVRLPQTGAAGPGRPHYSQLTLYPRQIMLQKLEVQVVELYGAADQAVAAYQQASGLGCPAGCVQCCYSEKVEATVLEMIPAAFHLFRTGQAEPVLKRLEMQESSRQCILFRADLSTAAPGGCTLYPFRALICRLFGFAGNTDRGGVPQLARCRHMPLATVALQGTNPESGGTMPLFHSYGLALTAMHPYLGTLRKPINNALSEALAKVGLIRDLETVPAESNDNTWMVHTY